MHCLITLYIFLVLNFQTSMYQPVSQQRLTYLWTDLEPATEYTFHVYACNGYTLECVEPSKAVKGTTLDGKSGPPSTVMAQCKFDKVHVADIFEFALCYHIRRCPLLPSNVVPFTDFKGYPHSNKYP